MRAAAALLLAVLPACARSAPAPAPAAPTLVVIAPVTNADASSPPPLLASADDAGTPADAEAVPDGVMRLSDTEFRVTRAFLEKVLDKQSEAFQKARIVPVMQNGVCTGIRLYGIKPGSMLAEIGFENGDVLEHVNGFDITTPEKALEAYSHLRTADRIVVDLVRRGQPVTVGYDVVEP
jgi:general secretion pathway protein C